MAAVYQNYGGFTVPTPVAIGSRGFPNWGSTFAGDLGALVTQKRFAAAVVERVFYSWGWINSGAMVRNPAIDFTTGSQIELPMVRPFIASKEYVESNATWGASGKGHLTVQKINADSAFMPIQQCAYAGGADDLSAWMSGIDPVGIMASFIGENMQKHTQETMRSLFDGLFGTAGVLTATHTLDVTTTPTPTEANFLSAATVMRGRSLIGERGVNLRILAMHSNVANYLATVGALTFSTSALATGGNIAWGGGGIGINNVQIADFMGARVVVDDTLVPSGTGATAKYPVYLMEPGQVSMGVRNNVRVRYDTNILSFQNVIAVDWSMAAGIPGISWKGTPTFPTDADFATPGNWENKLTDIKSIGLVRILCNNPW
jgi:hypothetical protein